MHCRLHCILHCIFARLNSARLGSLHCSACNCISAVTELAAALVHNSGQRPNRHPKFVALHLEFIATVLHCSVRAKRTAMQLRTMVANWQLHHHRRSSASPKRLQPIASATSSSAARLGLAFCSVLVDAVARCLLCPVKGLFATSYLLLLRPLGLCC